MSIPIASRRRKRRRRRSSKSIHPKCRSASSRSAQRRRWCGPGGGGRIGFEGGRAYWRREKEPLRAIANTARGEFFYAGRGAALAKVSRALNARLVREKKDPETAALFSATAAAFALAAAAF